jgi:hypothetical protein
LLRAAKQDRQQGVALSGYSLHASNESVHGRTV